MIISAIISGAFDNLAPLVKDEFSLLWNFSKEVEKISSTLSSIDAVLKDAEMKTVRDNDKQTEDWLRKLTRVAYEVRDVIDEWNLEDLRLRVNRLNASSSIWIQVTNCITFLFSNTWTRLKLGHQIKKVQEKLDQISSERSNLHLRESNHDLKSARLINPRQTISNLEKNVYGRDREREEIVDILVKPSNVAKDVSVLPILGLGGLGKTTLAQLVFNSEEITKHFELKFWVCVSEEFDIKMIVEGIIGATNETSVEILKNKIEGILKGKRYLLVLDDVWNENNEKWETLKSILNCGSNGAFILTTTRKKIVADKMRTVKSFELLPISDDDCWKLFKERAFLHGELKAPNFTIIGKDIAKKCKGVPLVAKTLGSQLGFHNDEREWCRTRDSEMWEISKNEESLLPILRLSYYDLPLDLRRCFVFCAIFPKDTEIEKEKLIQLWMAHDLIPITRDRELEDYGSIIWDELCWRSFFQEEKLDWRGVQTCKMHDLMHDLAQSVMKDECYTLDARSSSKDFKPEIRHLTIVINELDERLLGSFKNIGGLQSIISHRDYGKTHSKEIFSVLLKELSSLRVLDVHIKDVQSLDLRYLKHLRYLNLSGNTRIKTLPNGICDLLNLQTLNLENCSSLESLPRKTKDLINLRHLHLKGCVGLKYMPRGMGQLRNLKTLSMFVIGKESEGGLNFDELKELEIRGYLEIKNVERVSDACIARGISMSNKSRISRLELYWGDEDANRHEKIGEALEVSSRCVWRLKMEGYKGENMPKWVGESCASSLKRLELMEMENVQHIFTMNTSSSSSEIGMVDQLFPLLEKVYIMNMRNLRELVTSTLAGAFPNLRVIRIDNCPKLGALPPRLKSLKHVTLRRDCCDELLESIISNQSGLISLSIGFMDERRVLFPAGGGANNNKDEASLMIDDDEDGITSSSSRLAADNNSEARLANFQSLQYLWIYGCPNLRCLFDEEECEELATAAGAERERTRRGGLILTNITRLEITDCPELRISVEQWRNLITAPSLKELSISRCPKVVPSKGEEADQVIALLRSLRSRIGSAWFYVDFLTETGTS